MMKNKLYLALACLASALALSAGEDGKKSASPTSETADLPALRDAVAGKFLIGSALNTHQSSGRDTAAVRIVRKHFSTITAENCMKCDATHPAEGKYSFRDADEFVQFGEKHGMAVIGHCLIWHSQLPDWFCTDTEGKNVSPAILKQRMRDHIHTVVGRYKGRIKGWDVVNEAIVEDGSYRKSKFYQILGEEFIPLAFQYAHEADPDAELYYNDYGMTVPGRREGVVRLIRQLKRKGLRIDAVGMQAHIGMHYPSIEEFEQSIRTFAAEGVQVMITEWDMSALPEAGRSANIADRAAYRKSLNPYTEFLPDSVSKAWNERMGDFFRLFLKHADKISRVTAWGISDGQSWKNGFPIEGRTDYPLLFDRQYRMKPFLQDFLRQTGHPQP